VTAEDPRAVAAVLSSGEEPIRAAEVVAALSLATDLGTGQPLEHALRSAVLAVRLGELAGASAGELADTHYVALLHASGVHLERSRGDTAVWRRHCTQSAAAGLTERELEVLLVLVRGRSNQQIADQLGISAKTVGYHVRHAYEKAGVRSRAAATLWAYENDLVRRA
jgi:DNA-binding NarL/FixJ family response regulator